MKTPICTRYLSIIHLKKIKGIVSAIILRENCKVTLLSVPYDVHDSVSYVFFPK